MNFFLKYFNHLFIILIIFLLCSCAQVVMPGGGPKDVTPPRVVKYIPDSASTNFYSKSIGIFFDEYIQLKNLQNQLIISPPLAKVPVIKAKDKTVNISFDKDEMLKPNTTYVISFGDAIQDVNENNPKADFKYVFSTGDYIDSLSVSGKVQTAFDHRTQKDILVMLYKDVSDSVIYKSLPDYFTKTNENGSFKITNLSPGKYKIIALTDKNANYKYDDSENIAFIDTLIDVSSNKKLLLELFDEPPRKFQLKKHVYNSYGKIDFYFNKGSDSITIKPINYVFNNSDVIVDYSQNNDTLTYWFRNIEKDSLMLQLSNGYKIIDTIKLKLIKKEDAIKNKKIL